MNSFSGKSWTTAPSADNIESLIAQILKYRGLDQHENINDFLNPKISQLHDPFLINTMDLAVERIFTAISNQERIVVFGDFDADGITSTVILVDALKKLGAQVSYRIPDRSDDGHGLKTYLIDEIAEKNVQLIITCDCGINDQKETTHAASKGIDLIISDHHSPDIERFPHDALAVINPKCPPCTYPEKNLAGAGIAFKIVTALAQTFFEDAEEIAEFLMPYLEVAAIGLIADCVPLTGETRIITTFGLEKMKTTSWPGLRKLLERSNIDPQNVDAETVGFYIAPKLNAASRLGDVFRATELFLGNDAQNFERLTYLEGLNEKRKILTKEHILSAQEQIKPDQAFQFLLNSEWKTGILGLMASHISDKMDHPVFAGIEKDNNTIAFSARAPEGYSIIDGLNNCDPGLFLGFGGHHGAGGFQAKKENAKKIRKSLETFFGQIKQEVAPIPIEAILKPNTLNTELTEFLSLLAPFGMANQTPIFSIESVEITEKKFLGREKTHLKLLTSAEDQSLEFLGFFWGDFAEQIAIGKCYDICFTVSVNVWQGQKRIQLKLIDMRCSPPPRGS